MADLLDALEPPFTLICPPDHVLVKRVRQERTKGGILLPGTAAGKGAPIAQVVQMGPLLSGKWEASEVPWRVGDYVLVSPDYPIRLVAGDYGVTQVDFIQAVVREGEHEDVGTVYREEDEGGDDDDGIVAEHPDPPALLSLNGGEA